MGDSKTADEVVRPSVFFGGPLKRHMFVVFSVGSFGFAQAQRGRNVYPKIWPFDIF